MRTRGLSNDDGKQTSRTAKFIVVMLTTIPIVATIAYGAVDTLALGILFVLSSLIVMLRVADAWKVGQLPLSSDMIQLPLIGLIAIGCIQLLPLAGSDPAVPALAAPASQALSLDPYGTRFFVLHLIIYLIFFSSALVYVQGGRRLNSIAATIVIFGAALAFFGILQRLSIPDAIYGLRETPQAIPFGPFVNQHHFAALMLMTSGVALGLLFGSGAGRERKIFVALAAGIMGMAIVFTGSRGGLIGFLFVVAFAAVTSFVRKRDEAGNDDDDAIGTRARNMLVVGAAGLLVLFVAASVLFLGGQDSLLRGIGLQYSQDDVTSGRLHFWGVAWQIFLGNPVLGAGLNSFGVAFSHFDTWNGRFRVENAHNDYFQMLADGGVLGFACVAIFVVLLLKRGITAIGNRSDGLRRSIVVGAMAGCVGILVHSFLDFPLRTPANAFVFLLLVALIASNAKPERRRRSH
ncbi:MAG TPA: O-antigen ligase family protein [Pyrinomonadaceae bacterium]|nr:O-antigen ligase family protein [Pyrinomonadaceae bacterium]